MVGAVEEEEESVEESDECSSIGWESSQTAAGGAHLLILSHTSHSQTDIRDLSLIGQVHCQL